MGDKRLNSVGAWPGKMTAMELKKSKNGDDMLVIDVECEKGSGKTFLLVGGEWGNIGWSKLRRIFTHNHKDNKELFSDEFGEQVEGDNGFKTEDMNNGKHNVAKLAQWVQKMIQDNAEVFVSCEVNKKTPTYKSPTNGKEYPNYSVSIDGYMPKAKEPDTSEIKDSDVPF